jgi:hypothetical protein
MISSDSSIVSPVLTAWEFDPSQLFGLLGGKGGFSAQRDQGLPECSHIQISFRAVRREASACGLPMEKPGEVFVRVDWPAPNRHAPILPII